MWRWVGLLVVVCVGWVMHADAQLWSGVIDAPRAIDWSNAGVAGGIPERSTICTTLGTAGQIPTFAQSVTPAQITSALAACPAGQVVKLETGTYNFSSSGMRFGTNNVTLRGEGARNTILSGDGSTPAGCHIGDGQVINMCNNGANIGVDSPDHTATWNCDDTGGVCAQNRTTLTLSSNTGLTVGHTIWLDQLYDASDGYPATGDVWMDNWGSGDSYTRANRGVLEGHIVASCGTSTPGASCTSTTITISPGLYMPTFRSARTPGAWWANASTIIHDSGIEDLTINIGTDSGPAGALYLINATNCWIKGVRIMHTGTVSSGQPRLLNVINGMQLSIVDSYFHGYKATSLVSIYTLSPYILSHSLIQNNIIYTATNPFVQNSSSFGNVFAYNYVDSDSVDQDFSQSSTILHGVSAFNLSEGNSGRNFSSDNIHSAHAFTTLFRNHYSGQAHNVSGTETQAAMAIYAAGRFYNLIGNVAGNSQWTTYGNSQSPPAFCQSCIYEFGWEGTNSTATAATGNDTNVSRTIMRWGNWDKVTSTNDNGTNDSTGTRFVSGEVPSGITNYANTVPASQTLPPSFYLASLPTAWWGTPWGTPPWPPVGPDVSSGDVNNGSTEPTGGHVNKIPARLCFENTSQTSGVLNFDADTCYITAETGVAFLDDPSGLSLSGSSTPTFLSDPTGLDATGAAMPTFLGDPTGLDATAGTPTFLDDPTGLTLSQP